MDGGKNGEIACFEVGVGRMCVYGTWHSLSLESFLSSMYPIFLILFVIRCLRIIGYFAFVDSPLPSFLSIRLAFLAGIRFLHFASSISVSPDSSWLHSYTFTLPCSSPRRTPHSFLFRHFVVHSFAFHFVFPFSALVLVCLHHLHALHALFRLRRN